MSPNTSSGLSNDPTADGALISRRLRVLNCWAVQNARMGALPSLRAATDPSARSGDFYGPGGRSQYTGCPVLVEPAAAARDDIAASRLWEASERLTGVTYPYPEVHGRTGQGPPLPPR